MTNPRVSSLEAGGPPASEIAHSGPKGANIDTPPAANNAASPTSNDDLIKELNEMIKDHNFDEVRHLLYQHPHLDLNIIPTNASDFPLHVACQYEATLETLETLQRLLIAGANPKLFCGRGCNAVQCSADRGGLNPSVVKMLTRNYTDEAKRDYINSVDRTGNMRATHYVAMNKDKRIGENDIAFSALKDADWSLKNKYGATPFELAARTGNSIVTSRLAFKQWEFGKRIKNVEVLDSLCSWADTESQNTAYIQGLIGASVVQDSLGTRELFDSIIEHVTLDFRIDRDPEDPVGGNGRDSVCLFKKLELYEHSKFMSLAIPYFSHDTIGRIERRKTEYNEVIKDFNYCSTSNFNYLGLQCASTLDEYCHPSLDDETLADRNASQVLSRYQHNLNEFPREERNIIIVPQLWIWTFDDRLFTATHKSIVAELFDLFSSVGNVETYKDEISSYFTTMRSSAPQSGLFVDLLVGLIISECVNTLNARLSIELSRSVFGVFENSISQLSAKVRKYTNSQALGKNSIDLEKLFIFQVSDIREELSMIQSVLDEQEQVWRQYIKAKFPEFWTNPPEDQFVFPSHFDGKVLSALKNLERPQTQFAKYKRQIAQLDADAERVANSINLQLDLKSRHASLKEAHLATLMSSAVIGFTIITIIFTPLAFLVSLFALSVNHFQQHQSNSTLANGAPFYDSNYVGKWLVAIELASLFVTAFAVWLALKLTTGFSIRETSRQLLEAWRKKDITDRSAATKAAQLVAHKKAGGQPPVFTPSKAAVTKPQTSPDRNQSVRKRFRIWPREPRQGDVESSKER